MATHYEIDVVKLGASWYVTTKVNRQKSFEAGPYDSEVDADRAAARAHSSLMDRLLAESRVERTVYGPLSKKDS